MKQLAFWEAAVLDIQRSNLHSLVYLFENTHEHMRTLKLVRLISIAKLPDIRITLNIDEAAQLTAKVSRTTDSSAYNSWVMSHLRTREDRMKRIRQDLKRHETRPSFLRRREPETPFNRYSKFQPLQKIKSTTRAPNRIAQICSAATPPKIYTLRKTGTISAPTLTVTVIVSLTVSFSVAVAVAVAVTVTVNASPGLIGITVNPGPWELVAGLLPAGGVEAGADVGVEVGADGSA